MSSIFSGKGAWLQRAMLVVVAASLSGCFDGGSGDDNGGVTPPTAEQPAPTVPPPTSPAGNQPPEVSGTPASTVVVGQTYSFQPVASDADQDFLEFTIVNQPSWASFNDETGLLSGVPTDASAGESQDITITVTDGKDTRSIGPFKIRVNRPNQPPPPSNRAPTITGTPQTSVVVGDLYQFQPQALDADGDTLRFSISNRPAWASFSSTTGRLSGTPRSGNIATYSNIIISVNDGTATTLLPAFAIQVRGPDNNPPTIGGTPGTSVQAGQTYSFTPAASDPDGDNPLVYSILNQPRWATFSTTSGRLSGTPAAADVGNYSNVTIRVSDGRLLTALTAFTITVTAPPTNRAPTISGTPGTSATAGSAYAFTPSATDPEGASLGFTIENGPSWATLNTTTGRLSGTPTSANIGTFSNIVISVSDGTNRVSLPAFSITVSQATTGNASLSWAAPTHNTDGTAIGNLAGYRVVYGRSSSSLDRLVQISNAGASAYTITGLTSGTWYFAVKAYNTAGAESNVSNVGQKTIP